MKRYNYCMRVVMIEIIVWLLPCFALAGRKNSSCDIFVLTEKWCSNVSNNYTQPYCVTNFYHEDRQSSDVNYAEKCIVPAITNKLSSNNWQSLWSASKWEAIQLFCKTLLWKSDNIWRVYFAKPSSQIDSWDWQQTFDSRQSLFMNALCGSFTDGNWKYPFLEDVSLLDAYKWDMVDILKLSQKSNWKDLCSLSNGLAISDCDMAIYATKIYAGIMSDIFKIKYAQVLNVDTVDNFSIEKEKKALDFLSWYFFLKDGKSLENQYPKTFSLLQTDQKYYRDVLNTVKILNNSKLAQISQDSGCPIDWNVMWIDFVACALHSSQWDWFALTPSFVTLFYNEILHYRLFITFYEKRMVEKYRVSGNNYTEKNMRVLQSEISDFKQYFNTQIEASKLAQRNFEEFNMTYPLHIWMLLYTEKAESFRNNNLAKIIPSFYSLSEKLKNVQLPSS